MEFDSTSSTSLDEEHHHQKKYRRLYLKYVKKNKKLKFLLLQAQANSTVEVKYVLKKDSDNKPKKASKKTSKKKISAKKEITVTDSTEAVGAA